MGVPTCRHNRRRRGNRRAHSALKPPPPVFCSNCQAPIRSHHVCKNCGQYNKAPVVSMDRQFRRHSSRALNETAAAASAVSAS